MLFLESKEKQEGFERLMSAGNASIVSLEECMERGDYESITHVFLENENQKNAGIEVREFLANLEGRVYQVNFVAEYLLRYSEVKPEDFVLHFDSSMLRRRSSRKRRNA